MTGYLIQSQMRHHFSITNKGETVPYLLEAPFLHIVEGNSINWTHMQILVPMHEIQVLIQYLHMAIHVSHNDV